MTLVNPDEWALKKIAKDLEMIFNKAAISAIVSHALGVYGWAAEEARRGRFIVSVEADGTNINRLTSPDLDRIRNKALGNRKNPKP